jgi:hypothetical protein
MTSAQRFNRVVDRVRAQTERYEDRFHHVYRRNLRVMYREAAANLEDQEARVLAAASGWPVPSPDELAFLDRWVRKMYDESRPLRAGLTERMIRGVLAVYGIDFELANPFVAQVIPQLGQHITHVVESERAAIMERVLRAHDAGMGIPEAAREIRQSGVIRSDYRARMIARTEMTAAQNAAAIVSAQTVGMEYKTWLVSPGARYPRHEFDRYLNGQTVKITEPFVVRGYRMMWPAQGGPASEVVNCRCTVLFGNQPDGQDTGLAEAYQQGLEPPALTPAPIGQLLTDMHDAYTTFGHSTVARFVSVAARAQNDVHSIPSHYERAPVRMAKSMRPSVLGRFWPGSLDGQIELNENLVRAEFGGAGTILHEWAHFIDWRVIARELVGDQADYLGGSLMNTTEVRYFAEALREHGDTGGIAAVIEDHDVRRLLGTLRNAFTESEWHKTMDWKLANIDHLKYLGDKATFQKRYDYLTKPSEMFARAYFQWVAIRSGDQTLLKELHAHQGTGYAWQDDDFEPIADAMDKLFGRLGWRR